METHRLFFAADLSDAARDELGHKIETTQKGLPQLGREIRWTPPQNLHITLKFLGETPLEQLPRIVEAARLGLAEEPAAACCIHQVGAFRSGRGGAVIRAMVDEGKALSVLAGKLEAALESIGYERERRPYSAHVTLARTKSRQAARAVVGHAELQGLDIVFPATMVMLFRSDLGHGSPRYTALAEFKLGGQSSVIGGPSLTNR